MGGGTIYVIGLWKFARDAKQSAASIQNNFENAGSALFAFDLAGAKKAFTDAYQKLTGLKDRSDTYLLTTFISDLPSTFNNIGTITLLAIDLTTRVETLKNNATHWIVGSKGARLTGELRTIHEKIVQLQSALANLRQEATRFGYNLPDDIGAIARKLTEADQMLTALLPWLEDRTPHHVAILLQNNSEIRPAGGFLGSFADATIHRGGLAALEVRDIYDIDGQLKKKIAPPQPLQTLTEVWGARDANWFFDFPTSARKVTELLALSRVYAEKEITFDAAIALNPDVLRDILALTGPITIPDYNLTIDADSFLSLLQREVEAGEDNKAGRPKKILTILTPILIQKIGQLTEDQKKELLLRLGYHFSHKNIQVYFIDPLIEQYLKALGVAGDMASSEPATNNDYLAIVAANIAGGKTDIFMEQAVTVESVIDGAGEITNTTTISRFHRQTDATDPWYTKDNKVWLDIMTPLGSVFSPVIAPPSTAERSSPPRGGGKNQIDPDLEAAEMPTAFNRQHTNTWLITPPGETKTIIIHYTLADPVNFAEPYAMTFERQSGVNTKFSYTITAPEGYIWQESQSPIFTYNNDDPLGRIVIRLHLLKS